MVENRWQTGKLPEAVFTQSEFLNYVAPQGSTRFDYASVYYNQTQDVHPPLFYFLLHTVCSLFPGSFTKWTGLGMNFVLLGGTLAALYTLGMELFADWKKALFVCALYAFNREMISNVTMVRMYMLMTLLTILLALLVAKSLRRPSVPKYLLIGVTIYLGMMTQYFFVVYAFLLCAAYDLYLMFRREWKNAAAFSLPHLRALRNAAHLSVLVCTAALAGYGFAGVNSKQSAGSGAVPQRPAGADRLEHRRLCCRRRHYGRAGPDKAGAALAARASCVALR